MGNQHNSVVELLEEIKQAAITEKLIYPDNTVQIQMDPLTYGFIKVELAARHSAIFVEEEIDPYDQQLFGFQLLLNKKIKGRYAIAILVEQETGWKDRK